MKSSHARRSMRFRFGMKSMLGLTAFAAILVVFWNSTARYWFPDTETQINRIILSGGFVGTLNRDPKSGRLDKEERYPAGADFVRLTSDNFANREVNVRLFPNATRLVLFNIDDDDFLRLRRLGKLKEISFGECDISGESLRRFRHNALTRIDAGDSSITNKGLDEILKFRSLKILKLSYRKTPSQISAVDLQQLSKLTALTELTLDVSPDAPPTLAVDIRKLLPNCLVDVSVQDPIPTED